MLQQSGKDAGPSFPPEQKVLESPWGGPQPRATEGGVRGNPEKHTGGCVARPGSSVHSRGTQHPHGGQTFIFTHHFVLTTAPILGVLTVEMSCPWARSLRGWTAPSNQGPQWGWGRPGRGCALFTPVAPHGAPRPRPPEPHQRRNTRENGPIGKSGCELQGLLRVRPCVLLFVCCFTAKRVLRAGGALQW